MHCWRRWKSSKYCSRGSYKSFESPRDDGHDCFKRTIIMTARFAGLFKMELMQGRAEFGVWNLEIGYFRACLQKSWRQTRVSNKVLSFI